MINTQTLPLLSKYCTKRQNAGLPWAFPAPWRQFRSNSDNLLCQLLDSPWFCENPTLFKMRLPSKYHQSYFEKLTKGFKLFFECLSPSRNSKPLEKDHLFLISFNDDHNHDTKYCFWTLLFDVEWKTICILLRFSSYKVLDMIWLQLCKACATFRLLKTVLRRKPYCLICFSLISHLPYSPFLVFSLCHYPVSL
jgi:hypothetical protein